jgi:hypothetical protein
VEKKVQKAKEMASLEEVQFKFLVSSFTIIFVFSMLGLADG